MPPTAGIFLTTRERDCVQLLAAGLVSKQIADKLGVKVSTVFATLERARARKGVATSCALVAVALRSKEIA